MASPLPKMGAAVVGPDGIARNEWWLFWRDQAETLIANGVDPAVIADILARLDALESEGDLNFQIVGLASVQVFGTPQQGAVSITLQGDQDAGLGPTWFYGTLPDGSKGWQRLFDAMEAPNDGISLTDSGYLIDGVVANIADLPGSGTVGHAYRVLGQNGVDPPGLYAWNGLSYVLDAAADGVVGVIATDDLAAIEALATTGFAARTATDTWALRTWQNGPGVDITNPGGVAGDPQATFNSHTAPVDRIGGSTYFTVQDYINTMTSPGTIDGPALCIVESGIPATPIRVLAGKGMIRTADDDVSSLPFFDWAQTDFAQPADGLTRFYGVVYNAGAPIVQQRTTFNWDKDTEIPLGSAVIFTGGIAVITPNSYKTGDADTNIIQRFDAQAPATRDNSIGGLILGETGARNSTLTAGKIWSRLSDFDSAAKNSATTPMLSAFFNGAGLTVASGLTQWDNTRYNNLGSGTLVAMGLNKYANLWFFISIDGTKWGFAYGTNEYNTLGAAANEGVPAYLNQNFFQQALLLGRLIFQQGAATASLIESAFQQIFSTTAINNHNDLSGLQDAPNAVANEHYHLSSAQATAVANAVGTGGGFVTIAGAQGVTGAKTFTGGLTASGVTLTQSGVTTAANLLSIGGFMQNTGTGQQNVATYQCNIAPQGASLNALFGLLFIPTLMNSAAPITSIDGVFARIDSTGTYTGAVSVLNMFHAADTNGGAPFNPATIRGLLIDNLAHFTTNSRAIELQNASGAGKHNIYAVGTADNYLQGTVSIGTTNATGAKLRVNGDYAPHTDNTFSSGTASLRHSVVYAGTGTINTSDADDKTVRGALTQDELRAAAEVAREVVIYQWKDALEEKGVDGARLHVGYIAQRVRDIMATHGLDPFRYGFLCYDEWPEQPEVWVHEPATEDLIDEESGEIVKHGTSEVHYLDTPFRPAGARYGLRYQELTTFIMAAQEQRLQALEARLA